MGLYVYKSNLCYWANEKMKRMDGLEKNGAIGISTCISRCEKGIYEAISFDPEEGVNILTTSVTEQMKEGEK